jgi:hypothetical protein
MQWILHTRESAITSVRQKKKDEKRKEGNKKKGSIVEGIIECLFIQQNIYS